MATDDTRPHRMRDKTAIITGGSRGIGFAIAQRLVAEGARVIVTGRKQPSLDAAVEELGRDSAIGVAGRSDDAEHRAEVFETAVREFGGLDCLVCNAGINPVYGPLLDLDLDGARKVMEVNVISTLAWVQDAVRHPRVAFEARRGNVVILSSVTGQVPSPGIGWYGVSKAANAHLARTLGTELAPNIRVNAVAPAVIKTQFAQALYAEREAEVAATYPLGRLGEAVDIAAAVAWLASDDACWVTAQVLNIDGGLIAAGGTA